MRLIMFIILIGITPLKLSAQDGIKAQDSIGTLRVNIKNIESDEGKMVVRVYTEEKDDMNDPYLQKTFQISDTEAAVLFEDLPYAEYSVLVIHDQNSNGKLDHSFGLPAEPLGWSTGWKFSLFSGLPTFKKTKFSFSEANNTISITLK